MKKMLCIMIPICSLFAMILLSSTLLKPADIKNEETGSSSKIAKETELKTAFLEQEIGGIQNMTVDDIEFDYYGNFGGKDFFTAMPKNIVVTCAVEQVELGGYTFMFHSGGYYPDYFLCYVDGDVMTVKEAYKDGYITEEDLYEVSAVR